MIPDKARAGEYVSAAFLNYCRESAINTDSIRKGFEDLGSHPSIIGAMWKCNFHVFAEESIPIFSVFKLAVHTESPYLKAVKSSDGEKSGLYTNGMYTYGIGFEFKLYPITAYNLYTLAVDEIDPPAAGDYAQVKDATFVLEKGGVNFLCLQVDTESSRGLFLSLPSGGGALRVGFVVNNDLQVQSAGEVEQYEYNDLATGDVINVFNPHDVVFYKENTISGEEHPPDRVLILEVDKWDLPLVFPFMLSACDDLVPIFPPSDV